MRGIATVLVVLAGVVVSAQPSSALDPEQSRILALENAWNQAEEHKDIKALDALLDNALVYVDYDGSLMTKAQFLASAKQPALQPEQIVNEFMTVHVFADSAVVNGVYREKGKLYGKPYRRRGRFTDTWVNQNGTWRCVASQSTLIRGSNTP
jgi:ketosteroid isomerase-like protein